MQVNVRDPARVILTGTVVEEGGEAFVSLVRQAVQGQVWRPDLRSLDIVASPLKDSAALKGAAAMVYDAVFDVDGPLLAWSA